MSRIPLTPEEVCEAISEEELKGLLALFSVSRGGAEFFRLYGGIRNAVLFVKLSEGEGYTLTIYKPDPEAERRVRKVIGILSYLSSQNFPVPRVIKTKEGETYFSKEILGAERLVTLSRFIRGRKVFPYGKKHLFEAGKMLSRLHLALCEYPDKDELDEISFDDRFSGPETVLHLDFARGNLLFDEQENIVCILDFEEAAWGAPIIDVAEALAVHFKDRKNLTTTEIESVFIEGYKTGPSELFNEEKLPDLIKHFSREIV